MVKMQKLMQDQQKALEGKRGMNEIPVISNSPSESTIYHRAVQPDPCVIKNRNSSSTDEEIDTSDEFINSLWDYDLDGNNDLNLDKERDQLDNFELRQPNIPLAFAGDQDEGEREF